MESDSFFGFDPTQADEDTGFSYDREDDDDFDALNDETFGTVANTGDWEDQHRQLSGLLERDSRLDGSSSSGRPTPGGVSIPGSRGDDFFSNTSSSLSNGLNNLHNMGSGHPYSTPPKTSSLIDPVKLSESPGNGIWAPEPAMLEKMGLSRSGNSSGSFAGPPSQASANIFNMLQQAPSAAKQQQMNMLPTSQQQQNQRMFYNLPTDGSSSMFGSADNSSNSSNRFQQQQQTLLGNLSGMSSGSLSGLEGVQQRGSTLPLGFSGNVKSVADLEMEMRLQQLKNQANAADRVVRAEDLERQATSRSSGNVGKPLQPFFTQQQQLQQIQQNQLVEIQQKRPHQQQHHQQQHRVPQFHPLTGQPLNTGGSSSQPPHHPPGNSLNRMQQPNMGPNYQYHMQQQQQQQQFLLANMGNRQPRPNQGHLPSQPLQPPHLAQNYHNFPNHQRNVGGNFGGQPNFGGGNNPSAAVGVAGMGRGNWNNGFDNTNNPSGGPGSYFDRRNNGGFNNRGGGNMYDDRRQQQQGARGNKFPPGGNGYDRNNGGGNQRDYGGSYNNNNSNNGMAGGGRVRRDSEAEWEEWERRREEDEYAGLMTPKQKSWLRNIQTMQLATEDPYRDDYYYVVYTAKRNRSHPEAPLQIQGLNMLLPALPGDQEKDAGNTYQPPAMENSLGKLQVASVNAPRKIMDVQAVRPDTRSASTALQLQMRTHRLLLLSIEKLYAQYMELEDLDRKAAYLPDSPTRDSFIRRAKQLAEEMWDVVNTNESNMLAVMTIRKGKTLVANLVARLGPTAGETALGVVLCHLPQLTRNSQPQYQNTLNILWPTADNMLATASPQLLLALASKLLPHLKGARKAKTSTEGNADAEVSSSEGKDELIPVLASKFGISVIVGLLLRGEQVHQEIIKYEAWQDFLSRVISVLATVQNPTLTNTLVRDSGVGEASKHPTVSTSTSKKPPAPVVVLGRGQSLSSLTRQRGIAGNLASSITTSTAMGSGAGGRCLTPPLPLVAVTASNMTAGDMGPVLQQPSAHLARCTEQVQSGALAAAQSALQRLDIAVTTSASATNSSIASAPAQSQQHNLNLSGGKGFARHDDKFGASLES